MTEEIVIGGNEKEFYLCKVMDLFGRPGENEVVLSYKSCYAEKRDFIVRHLCYNLRACDYFEEDGKPQTNDKWGFEFHAYKTKIKRKGVLND